MPEGISTGVFMALIVPIRDEIGSWPLRIFGAGYGTLQSSDLDLSTSDGTIVKSLAPLGMSSA